MIVNKLKYIILGVIVTMCIKLNAQEYKQDIVVPLSKPGANGSLEVGLISGSITVEGYNGKEVIVVAKADGKRSKQRRGNDEVKGLKKIGSSSFDIEIEEKDNHVEISSNHFNNKIDLEIKVPKNFSLELATVNNGDIKVTNVIGDHEISNVNGDIEMYGISGSTVVSAVNGKIEITFDKVSSNKPMAFAGMNKKIDITLPADTKATLKMTSKMGDIFTDFDVDIVKTNPEVKKSTGTGTYKVSISKYLIAKINGGGPEFKFKNFNGNIIVRKKK